MGHLVGLYRWPAAWLGSRDPEVQADPEEAQIPGRPAAEGGLPSMPSKQTLTFPGRRWSRSPLRAAWGMAARPSMSLSRRGGDFWRRWPPGGHRRFGGAAARPTMLNPHSPSRPASGAPGRPPR